MIAVLRLGERPERDHRINTHLALVARAFGADKLIMFFKDPSLLSSVSSIGERFGGDFVIEVEERNAWRKIIRNWKGIIVHLSMYGLSLDEGIQRLSDAETFEKDHHVKNETVEEEVRDEVVGEEERDEVMGEGDKAGAQWVGKEDEDAQDEGERENRADLLIILGGEKVPAEIYQKADFNISVGNQPHSEVAALAVFLDRYHKGSELHTEMKGWKQQIIPMEHGKKMISQDE